MNYLPVFQQSQWKVHGVALAPLKPYICFWTHQRVRRILIFQLSLAGVCPFLKSIVESIPCEVLGLIIGKVCHYQGKIRICKWSKSRSVVSPWTVPAILLSPWNSPGQNTGVGSHSLLQGIFPIQKSNQCLLHCRQILYQLSNQGNWKGS